jgi:hypothetical protein
MEAVGRELPAPRRTGVSPDIGHHKTVHRRFGADDLVDLDGARPGAGPGAELR